MSNHAAARDHLRTSQRKRDSSGFKARAPSRPYRATSLSVFQDQVLLFALPIDFQHCFDDYDEDVKDSVEILVGGSTGMFYIGATVDPINRWRGRAVTERGSRMAGHAETWGRMHIIALRSYGAGKLETAIIRWAKEQWPDRCTNLAMDSRGQCRNGTNFIYICF